MAAGFRGAYARLRQFHVRDCLKHELSDNVTEHTDDIINRMSLVELMDELEFQASIIDDERTAYEASLLTQVPA